MWLCDDDNDLVQQKHNNENVGQAGIPMSVIANVHNELQIDKNDCKPIGYYVNRRENGLFPAPLPQESAVCEKACEYFWFLGVFLAKVLQDMRLVDLPLSSSFLQLLCHNKMPVQHTSSSSLSQLNSGGVMESYSNDDLMMSSMISEESTELSETCSKLLNQTSNNEAINESILQHQSSTFKNKWYNGILSLENLAEIDPIRYEFIKMLQELLARKQAIELNDQLSSEQKQKAISDLKLKTTTNGVESEVHINDLAMNFVYLPTSSVYGYEYANLIPNGIDVDVNIDNIEEYCDLLVNFMLQDGIAKQLDAFHNGFCQVFPLKKLAAFSPVEARMMICGEQHPQWTREDLINYTEPKLGYSKDRLIIVILYKTYLLVLLIYIKILFLYILVLDFYVLLMY